ncbi:MAG: hypothetical protein P4L67_04810 [Candidatus Pacebacteria bacterium]|nr:hypothetical protein [Candidatus Paceibacterota bacterium]
MANNPYSSDPIQFGGDDGVQAAIFVGENGSQGGIRPSWTDQGLVVQIDFLIAWKDYIKFLQLLAGSSSYSGGKYYRKLPTKLPVISGDKSPGLPGQQSGYLWDRMICMGTGEFRPVKFRTDGDGSATGMVGWGMYAMVVIPTTWGVPTYIVDDKEFDPNFPGADLSGYPFTTTRIKAAGEAYSPYASGYKFATSGENIDDSKVGLVRPKLEITITRHNMPFVDSEKLNNLVGKTNDIPLGFGNTAFKAESMLYLSYEYEARPDVATGGLTYDITHHILANGLVEDVNGSNQSSWNYFVSPDGKWDQVIQVKGGEAPYSTAELQFDIWPEYAD